MHATHRNPAPAASVSLSSLVEGILGRRRRKTAGPEGGLDDRALADLGLRPVIPAGDSRRHLKAPEDWFFSEFDYGCYARLQGKRPVLAR